MHFHAKAKKLNHNRAKLHNRREGASDRFSSFLPELWYPWRTAAGRLDWQWENKGRKNRKKEQWWGKMTRALQVHQKQSAPTPDSAAVILVQDKVRYKYTLQQKERERLLEGCQSKTRDEPDRGGHTWDQRGTTPALSRVILQLSMK